MRNSLRILHETLFRCLVKLFFFFIVIIIFVATFMVNKDEYIMNSFDDGRKPILHYLAFGCCLC